MMEDCIDVRCPFCRSYLTDVDGIWECQEGCGVVECLKKDGGIYWLTPEKPFQCINELRASKELYNSDGELIGGDEHDRILFMTGRWE